jgi:hypothetical protein
MIRSYIKVPLLKTYWNPYIGWSLFGNVNGRCKFTFTVLRFKRTKPL